VPRQLATSVGRHRWYSSQMDRPRRLATHRTHTSAYHRLTPTDPSKSTSRSPRRSNGSASSTAPLVMPQPSGVPPLPSPRPVLTRGGQLRQLVRQCLTGTCRGLSSPRAPRGRGRAHNAPCSFPQASRKGQVWRTRRNRLTLASVPETLGAPSPTRLIRPFQMREAP
jgi:hypothetical protein